MLQVQKISRENAPLLLIQTLFNEYAQELNADLNFQQFDSELQDPFKKYGDPHGSLFIAYMDDQPSGCIALQQINATTCEMKRLYVRPAFRNNGIGDELVKTLLDDAKAKGYTTMVLDTLDRLEPAIRMYKRHGFDETTAYYDNPLPGVVYMQKQLLTSNS